jgi:EmrB/QacA subfamily drug resistance transporter
MHPHIITNPLHQKFLLTVVAIGMLIDSLDGSIVTIILPQISKSFDIDAGTASWVTITYLLMMAGLILIFGKYAERGYLRVIFPGGILIFTLGSAACGLSLDFETLLGSRIIQGIGAAMIAVSAPLLCVTYLPKNMLGVSLGTITMASSVGFTIGPAIGGFLAHYLSWHWCFLINIPIGLLIIPFALYVIPADVPRIIQPFDRAGAVILFALITSGVYTLERISHLGITNHQILVSTGFCVLCTLLFLIRELHYLNPLINIRVFKVWKFTVVFLAFLIMNITYFGFLYLLPFYLQAGMQFDTMISGLYMLIPPAITAVLSIPLGGLSDRYGRRPFAIVASLILIAISSIYLVILPDMGLVPLIAGILFMGLFGGFAGGSASSRVVENAPHGEEGTGTSLMINAMYLGGVIGIALTATAFTIMTSGSGIVSFSDLDPAIFMHGFHFSMMVGFVLALLAFVLTVIVKEKRGCSETGDEYKPKISSN